MEVLKGYIDGVVVTALAFVLSPPETRLRNAAIIGIAHGVLHGYACDQLHRLHDINSGSNPNGGLKLR
jgi:hypothetical protein